MAINRIQFQKGLSFRDFQARYGTEVQCRDAMVKAKWPHGFQCPKCGSGGAYFLVPRQLFQCKACHHQTSVTVGTVMESSHLPLRTWFEAMYRLSHGKHSISALELKRYLGVRYPTAYYLKQKILCAMSAAESSRKLKDRVEIDDAYAGGATHGGKRGRGAPGKQPFLVAVQTAMENHRQVIYTVLKAVTDFKIETIEAWAKKALDPGTHVVSDGLHCFRGVAASGASHEPIKSEGGWKGSKMEAFQAVNTVISNLKGNILGVCRWCSARHLPRYLAEHQFRFNRRFNLQAIFPALFAAVTNTPPHPVRLLVSEACG
ncbi:IS1595 family transposase [Holophaga foetida]|uniref:IS1595 family transposase n=1 Tax=Holophaga foetida TaxID=35839 RepID=UPI00024717ED